MDLLTELHPEGKNDRFAQTLILNQVPENDLLHDMSHTGLAFYA